MHPIPGKPVTTAYGARGSWWTACGWHTGIDIAAPAGTEILAPIAGTIRHRSYGSAFGPYAHAISPSKGQPFADDEVFLAHTLDRLPDGTEVEAGQPIARVGALGNASGPHLHLEYHKGKMQWSCAVMRDPRPVLDWQPSGSSGGWLFPAGSKMYRSKLCLDGHESNADRVSDSIKMLQEMLNRHSMPGGSDLPVTGRYWTQTDAEVRLCQRLHIPPEDPVMRSYVGHGQWQHLAAAVGAPYVWHDDGPPRLPDEPGTPDPPQSAWHPAASLVQLRDEVDGRWPDRDRSSDGMIGDAAHATSLSEHNPVGHPYGPQYGTPGCVHAIDVTARGIDAEAVVCAAIRDPRVWYVIFDGSIWSKTYGWERRAYTGSNPHTTHLHISLAADDQTSAVRNESDLSLWLVV